MSAPDARGHTVPAATDHPQRQNLLDLSLTINGLTTVADTTARTAYVAALAAASPAQTVSTSKPAFIYRTDSATYEHSVDGTNWFVIPTRLAQSYSPGWASSGTQPVIGNGSIVGTYTLDDQFVDFMITITLGSTSTVGTGAYTSLLPLSPVSGRRYLFPGWYSDISLAKVYEIAAHSGGSTTLSLFDNQQPSVSMGATAPVIPASGDSYQVHGRYQHA